MDFGKRFPEFAALRLADLLPPRAEIRLALLDAAAKAATTRGGAGVGVAGVGRQAVDRFSGNGHEAARSEHLCRSRESLVGAGRRCRQAGGPGNR